MKHNITFPLIALAALGVALTTIACGDPEAAKAAARVYAKDLGYEVTGISCAETDTDDDGYIACSVRVKGQDLPLALECGRGTLTFAGGCKQAQIMRARPRQVVIQ